MIARGQDRSAQRIGPQPRVRIEMSRRSPARARSAAAYRLARPCRASIHLPSFTQDFVLGYPSAALQAEEDAVRFSRRCPM